MVAKKMVSLHVAEQRLYKKLESGDHYEAQQQVLTVYRRLLSKGNVEESWGLLETAIAAFLEFEQVAYACEVAHLMLSDAQDSQKQLHQGAVAKAQQYLSLFRQHQIPVTAYQSLANATIKLSRLCSDSGAECSTADICTETGAYIWELRGLEEFDSASTYLARGDIEKLKNVAIQASEELSGEDAAYLHLYCFLKVLASSSKYHPRVLMDSFYLYKELRQTQQDRHPITNFGQLLWRAVETRDAPLLGLATREYRRALDRDPQLAADIAKIQSVYCTSSKKQPGLGNMFDGLLGALGSASVH